MRNSEEDNLQKALVLAEVDWILARNIRQVFVKDALKQAQLAGVYLPPSVFKDKKMLETAIRLLTSLAGIIKDA